MSGVHAYGQVNTFGEPTSAQMQNKRSKSETGESKDLRPMTVPTWVTEAFIAGAHTVAGAVRAGAERAEVHELGTRWPREAQAAAAAEMHAVRVAGAVVLAWGRGTGVHLFLAGSTEVSCQKTQTGTGKK